ncbi:MAG: hypothetical protein ABWK00_06825 [Desulfurococcaceae archaeon]
MIEFTAEPKCSADPRARKVADYVEEFFSRIGVEAVVRVKVHCTCTFDEENLLALIDAKYPLSHEAFENVPTIHVCLDALGNPSEDVLKALAYHEAAHSLLHGSIGWYVVDGGPWLEALRRRYGSAWAAYTYVLSVLLKDLMVVRFLASRGLWAEVKSYAEFCASEARDLDPEHPLDKLMLAKLAVPFSVLPDAEVERLLAGLKSFQKSFIVKISRALRDFSTDNVNVSNFTEAMVELSRALGTLL